jgi:hypothetical protein
MSLQPSGPKHWHITRDIKPKGECPACDLSWKVMEEAAAKGRAKQEAVDSRKSAGRG